MFACFVLQVGRVCVGGEEWESRFKPRPLPSGNYRSCEESAVFFFFPLGWERGPDQPTGKPRFGRPSPAAKGIAGQTRCPFPACFEIKAQLRRAKPSQKGFRRLSQPRTKPARRETSSFPPPHTHTPRSVAQKRPEGPPLQEKRPDPAPCRPLPLTPAGRTRDEQGNSPNDPETQRRAGAPLPSAWLSRT